MSGDRKGVSGNLGESFPGKCKDPEAGTRLACFRKEGEAKGLAQNEPGGK